MLHLEGVCDPHDPEFATQVSLAHNGPSGTGEGRGRRGGAAGRSTLSRLAVGSRRVARPNDPRRRCESFRVGVVKPNPSLIAVGVEVEGRLATVPFVLD